MEWPLFLFLMTLAGAIGFNRFYIKQKISFDPIVILSSKPQNAHQKVEVFYAITIILWWIHLFIFSIYPIILTWIPSFYAPFFIFDPIGYTFMYIGFLIVVYAMLTMKESWRMGIDEKNPGPLVTKGLYKYVRHPIYSALFLILGGSLFILPNLLSLVLILCSIGGLVTEAFYEEEFLLKKYPHEYTDYMNKTGRFFPKNLF